MRRLFAPLLLILSACNGPTPPSASVSAPPPESTKLVFTAPVSLRAPTFASIPLPAVPGESAVWGGTGRDPRGHIYFGICCDGVPDPSAHLAEYDPATGVTVDRGGVVENLRRLGLAAERQQKIHSKIVPMSDGYLYFASMDEHGEHADGSRLPTAGSHLWRVKPDGGDKWEHLGAVPEAVIAAAAGGRFVYFLAYFGHVLIQYDPTSGGLRRVTVGSHGGHTSRNFVADPRGHVFVPRVSATEALLVEYDSELIEVGRTLLADYSTTPDASAHGIVGVAELADGGRAFVTDRGHAYRLADSVVTDLGLMHPAGTAYLPCLFSPDGTTQLVSLGYRSSAERRYEWVVFDLATKKGQTVAVTPPVPGEGWSDLLVYGSVTRDDAGRFYVAGRYVASSKRNVPAAWALTP